MTIMAVVKSKLSSGGDDDHIAATSHEDTAFTWGSEYEAILAVVEVNIGSHVKDEVLPSFTFVYIELLPL